MTRVDVLERMRRVAPLGLRCQDMVSRRPVSDGLEVDARRVGGPTRTTVRARLSPSGIFVFHHLPDLRELEAGAGDGDYWSGIGSHQEQMQIRIEDRWRRYLPVLVETPAPVRGIVGLSLPQLGQLEAVPLFPATTANDGDGLAIRADLVDQQGAAAAWALMRATAAGLDPVFGIADHAGRLLLRLPHPPLQPFDPSDPGASATPLREAQWQLTLAVFYQPSQVTVPFTGRQPPAVPLSQALAQARADWQGHGQERTVSLRFTERRVLRTSAASATVAIIAAGP